MGLVQGWSASPRVLVHGGSTSPICRGLIKGDSVVSRGLVQPSGALIALFEM